MNPFLLDRYCPGDDSVPALHEGTLRRMRGALREGRSREGIPGRVILLRAGRAGAGKSHLLGRLAEECEGVARVIGVDLKPETLADWESQWRDRLNLLGPGEEKQVFVLDHLDDFFGESRAGIRIARLVERMAEHVPGSFVILSVNQDVWEQVFARELPGALVDLLTWEVAELEPLDPGQAEELVIQQLERWGYEDHVILQFLEVLDLPAFEETLPGGLTPRAVIRRARRTWAEFAQDEAEEEEDSEIRTVPFPSVVSETGSPQRVIRSQSWSAAEQARTHLNAVAEALRRQAGPRHSDREDGGVLRVLESSPEEAPPSARNGSLPPEVAASPKRSESLPRCFQDLRHQYLEQNLDAIRPEILYGLLRRVGERFPSIEQRIVGLDAPVRERFLEWKMFRRLQWIGFAPLQEEEVWRQAIESWNSSPHPSNGGKLVGFARADEPAREGQIGQVDVVALNRELLAGLYAAEELMRCAKSLLPGVSDLRVSGFLANELDFFWSRLTRRRKAGGEDDSGAEPSSRSCQA